MTLIRWKAAVAGFSIEEKSGQKRVRLGLNELVCMTKEEAATHEKEILKGGKAVESVYSKDVIQLVERRREEEKYYQQYR